MIKLTPALNLVGTRPIKQPTPNNIKVGSGRRGIGSRGYGEFVVVPSNGPFIHNVTLEISVRMVEKQLIVMKEDLFYFKELMKNMMFLT